MCRVPTHRFSSRVLTCSRVRDTRVTLYPASEARTAAEHQANVPRAINARALRLNCRIADFARNQRPVAETNSMIGNDLRYPDGSGSVLSGPRNPTLPVGDDRSSVLSERSRPTCRPRASSSTNPTPPANPVVEMKHDGRGETFGIPVIPICPGWTTECHSDPLWIELSPRSDSLITMGPCRPAGRSAF